MGEQLGPDLHRMQGYHGMSTYKQDYGQPECKLCADQHSHYNGESCDDIVFRLRLLQFLFLEGKLRGNRLSGY